MGIFDFFKNKKQKSFGLLDKRRREIKFVDVNEVSTIIIPHIYDGLQGTSDRKVIWKDLKGTTVPKVPITYRDLSYTKIRTNQFKILFYLGLKKFKNSERWVPIKKEDVDSKIQDDNFINIHSTKTKQELKQEKKRQELKITKEKEKKRQELEIKKNKLLKSFDKDGNGIIDIVESDDFMKLLRKHQSVIIEFDKESIDHLVKVSKYLKTKRSNIQNMFLEINKTKDDSQLVDNVGLLKNLIHTYEIILFHSLNMITSILEKDRITFREIYEEFDKLKIFRSDYEREMTETLSEIKLGINRLLNRVNSMERNIINGLHNLTYVTQDGFSNLNNSLSRELQSINSSIDTNNLLTGIQTYQLYKINKQTKGLLNN
jgi:hypothetical protein